MANFTNELGPRPLIYLITDGSATVAGFAGSSRRILKLVECAVRNGISLIQIREKRLPARFLFQLTSDAATITRNSNSKLLVNDRADIALAAGADGVHLTSRSVSPETLRAVFPSDFLIGVSTHSREEIANAKKSGADFAVFGPVFATPGKGTPTGLREFPEILAEVRPFPVLGLGGIDQTNFGDVLGVADGFAAIRFLNSEENIARLNAK
ncbi:MAG: thiamine phosphate synthase [Acidobacteria bacterium]|nr:thiamine phosphate synthase [Acidobacteriota bacterium]